MKSNYKRIGHHIQLIDERNSELAIDTLLGLSIDKVFIPSVANTVGTDMTNYKIIKKGQFACSLMQVRRDKKMPVALLNHFDEAIISQAYPVFEVINHKELLPEYLMMWMSRSEFDRHACFLAVGGVRGSLEWDDFCNMELPIPDIATQREIVREYNVIVDRIQLNEQLCTKLEEAAQAIYKDFFDLENGHKTKLGNICSLITDGKHADCRNDQDSGYYFVSVKDINTRGINYENARQIVVDDFHETDRRTNLQAGDIILTNTGTIGRMAIIKDVSETRRTTFQKSVAILKPKPNFSSSYYLYSLLKFHIKEIRELAHGTSQSNLLLGDLKRFEVFHADFDLVQLFEDKVTSIFQQISSRHEEDKRLMRVKNLLLSKIAAFSKEAAI